jgi:hypothetical protein
MIFVISYMKITHNEGWFALNLDSLLGRVGCSNIANSDL